MKTITAGQIKKIHALINALAIDDDTYRTMLFERFQVNSSKKLSFIVAGLFINELETMALAAGVWEKRTGRKQRFNDLDGRAGMASPAQLRKVEALWAENSRVPEPQGRMKALRSFIYRVAGVSDLRFLDDDGAGKVLNALGTMDRKRKSAAIKKPYKSLKIT